MLRVMREKMCALTSRLTKSLNVGSWSRMAMRSTKRMMLWNVRAIFVSQALTQLSVKRRVIETAGVDDAGRLEETLVLVRIRALAGRLSGK